MKILEIVLAPGTVIGHNEFDKYYFSFTANLLSFQSNLMNIQENLGIICSETNSMSLKLNYVNKY